MAKQARTRHRIRQVPVSTNVGKPDLNTEFANRLVDPFETNYLGLLRTNDPLLLERGDASLRLYKDLVRDGTVFRDLQKRKLALVGKDWQITPIDKENAKATQDAEAVTDILKAINFDGVCQDLLEALMAGYSVAEVVWTVRDGLVVPARIPARSQQRFVYVQDDPNQPPELRLLTRENMMTGIPVPDRKFIVHRVNPTDDNPYGTGLGLQLYWPVFFKRKGIVAWAKLNDRFGAPTPHGKYPNRAGPKEKDTLEAALRAFSNDGYIMTPEGMDIALLESKLTGSVTTQESLCQYMDDWISGVLIGREPRADSGGAQAAASKERQDVRQDLVQADSDLLSETLNATLIRWICEYNGFEPCLVYRQIKEEDDTKAMAETDKIIHEMGFDLDENTVREKYGEGWSKRLPPAPSAGAVVPVAPGNVQPGTAADARFAESQLQGGQQIIDDAIAAVEDAELAAAMAGLFEPLLAAIDGADSFEDALAAAQAAYPSMDTSKLQALVANGVFGAALFGRANEE